MSQDTNGDVSPAWAVDRESVMSLGRITQVNVRLVADGYRVEVRRKTDVGEFTVTRRGGEIKEAMRECEIEHGKRAAEIRANREFASLKSENLDGYGLPVG